MNAARSWDERVGGGAAPGLRGVLALFALAGVLAGAGCKSNPYCLNCTSSDVDLSGTGSDGPVGPTGDLAGADFATHPDLAGQPCQISNGGVEICDALDNDCNGITDDVAPAKLADPNNCGACGNACNFTAQKQFGTCDTSSGTPTCKPGACLPGFVDTDGNPANGCDYQCTPTNNGVEICDGLDNDCDKQIDEGFDKMNDPANCGTCGTSCARPNTTGTCTMGACDITSCAAGYKDLDGQPNNGCEYHCPVFPTQPEICDGIDQDCDGVKDNAPTDVGASCNNFCGTANACWAMPGAGSCAPATKSSCTNGCCGQCTQGMTVCSGGVVVCQPGVRPAIEACDGADNNCDGRIDEGFNTQTDPLNCGSCGHKCSAETNMPASATSSVLAYSCSAGICGISACQPGFKNNDTGAFHGGIANGCEYTCPVYPTTVEVCNGLDDDCDGSIDELQGAPGTSPSFVAPLSTNFCQQGTICSGAQPVCCGASGWLCDYRSVNAGIEIQEMVPYTCKTVPGGVVRNAGTLVFAETKCDNIDGDCRNGVDDAFPTKGNVCANGNGLCAGTSTFKCGTLSGTTCTPITAGQSAPGVCCDAAPVPGNSVAEECNGVDDNCDGQVDERIPNTPPVTLPPTVYAAGYTDRFVKVRNAPALWVYAYEASRIDSRPAVPPPPVGGTPAKAGTASNSRACSKPSVPPWASVTWQQAKDACEAVRLQDSPPGTARFARLCTQAEWQIGCEGPGGPQTNAYSYSSGNTAYLANACNDLTRNLGLWVTGFDSGVAKKCYADWTAAGKVYDMSGNLMEWTSDPVTVGMTTYHKVRGGAYNSPSDGTAPDGTSCEFDFNILPNGFANANVGFRCCADFTP